MTLARAALAVAVLVSGVVADGGPSRDLSLSFHGRYIGGPVGDLDQPAPWPDDMPYVPAESSPDNEAPDPLLPDTHAPNNQSRLSDPEPIRPGKPLPALPELRPSNAYLAAIVDAFGPDAGLALAVTACESQSATDPKAFDLAAANGGPMQINRESWRLFFEVNYGWSWSEVVGDPAIHAAAARIIFGLAGGFGPWKGCLG